MVITVNQKQFIKDRDEAAKSYDVETFRKFYRKYQILGVYHVGLPTNNEVIERTMRKIVYNVESSTEEEKAEAEKWLIEHGSDTSFF